MSGEHGGFTDNNPNHLPPTMRLLFILTLLAIFTLSVAIPTPPNATNTAPAAGATTIMFTVNVSKQIHEEAVPIFYRKNTFEDALSPLLLRTIAVINSTETPATSLQTSAITSISVTATPATSPQSPIIITIIVMAMPAPSPTKPKHCYGEHGWAQFSANLQGRR